MRRGQGAFPYGFVGTFIEAGSSRLAREIPQLSLQFVGTFPNPSLLRS